MSEERWNAARLIPTSGISGAEEQERRATSALLAVLSIVREFGRALTKPLGAPAGHIKTFIEVPFELEGKRLFPDGLIRVSWGQKTWTALVEVKTGSSDLEPQQLENYLDIAKAEGFDALITISNQIPPHAGQHPTHVDKRKLKTVALHHYSWSQILAEAVMQKEHRGVADTEQEWILSELIRYLEHPRSGALEFDDMGSSWTSVRDAVLAGTLRLPSDGIGDVTSRFDALLRYASLRLGQRLGTEVVPLLSRKEQADPTIRSQALQVALVSHGTLDGSIRIPGAVGPLTVTTDIRAGKVTCHVDVDAPKEGKPTTRVNWIVRQLQSAPATTRIEAFTAYGRGSTAELLATVRANPSLLILDPAKELRTFRIGLDLPLGLKRGKGKGGFVDAVLDAINTFYAEVLSGLKAWNASAPKLVRDEPPAPLEPVAERLRSSALSSQDDPAPDPAVLSRAPRPAPVQRAASSTETLATGPIAVIENPRDVAIQAVDVARPRLPTRRELRLMAALPADAANEGWFQPPGDERVLRWWTGSAWSTHVHALES